MVVELLHLESFHALETSAAQGCMQSEYALGYMNMLGIGFKKNETAAFELFKKSAINGYRKAQLDIAFMYDNGIGVFLIRSKLLEYSNNLSKESPILFTLESSLSK